jgi:hypothetical protein
MSLTTTVLVWSIIAHLVADWLFQNDWMANNKNSLLHPASYVHGLVHLIFLLAVFPFWAALIVSLTHVIIDTRKPLLWWRRFYKQNSDGDVSSPIFMWEDQVLHILILAIMSIIIGKYSAPSFLLTFFIK